MSAPPRVDPPTRPLYRPRVSRAAPDSVGSDAVTETTTLRALNATGTRASDRVPDGPPGRGDAEAGRDDDATAITSITALSAAASDTGEARTTVVRRSDLTATRGGTSSSGPSSGPSSLPPVRRLPGPSETGRFPSPKPRPAEGDPATVAVAASTLADTRAPVRPSPQQPTSQPTSQPQPVAQPPRPSPPRISPPSPTPRAGTPVVGPTSTPVARPTPTPRPTPSVPSTPSAPAASAATAAPVRPATAPAVAGSRDSAAALERAGLLGLHPLTREPRVKRRGTRRMVAEVPAPYSLVGDGEDVPALLTRMYAMVVRDHWGGGEGDTTHVVQLTPWYACDLGFELVSAGRIIGHAPVHGDVTPDVPVDPPEPDAPADAPAGAPTPTIVSLRHPRVDESARAALTDAERIVVVADTSRSDRRQVQEAVHALRELGLVVAGLVIYRGRIPRDPSYGR